MSREELLTQFLFIFHSIYWSDILYSRLYRIIFGFYNHLVMQQYHKQELSTEYFAQYFCFPYSSQE